MVKSLQKEQIAKITQYDPQSAGINLQSTQSDLTPQTLTLIKSLTFWVSFEVIYTKYSKHYPYTVAHTIDFVCRKC